MDPGTKLGHYEILSPLGEGGMGQVYRARDTTLDRDVAIKVLPEDFADDAGRLARFEREAKLLIMPLSAQLAPKIAEPVAPTGMGAPPVIATRLS